MTRRLKQKYLFSKQVCCLLVTSALFGACREQTVYHSFRALPWDAWHAHDTVDFAVQIPDSNTTYQLSVEVRNRNDYPYQNLRLYLDYATPDSLQMLPADTLNLILADSTGQWKGQGWGGLYQHSFPVKPVSIQEKGTYTFKISLAMPDEELKGINDIGIKLEK